MNIILYQIHFKGINSKIMFLFQSSQRKKLALKEISRNLQQKFCFQLLFQQISIGGLLTAVNLDQVSNIFNYIQC